MARPVYGAMTDWGGKKMAKNLVAQVGKAGGEFELVEREMPQPGGGGADQVQACGICF
jgi:hypothetical protein